MAFGVEFNQQEKSCEDRGGKRAKMAIEALDRDCLAKRDGWVRDPSLALDVSQPRAALCMQSLSQYAATLRYHFVLSILAG